MTFICINIRCASNVGKATAFMKGSFHFRIDKKPRKLLLTNKSLLIVSRLHVEHNASLFARVSGF